MEGETTYNVHTVDEAAAILQETPERVREMLVTGDLQGIAPGATVSRDWKVLLPTGLAEDPRQDAPVEERAESPPEDQDEAPAADESAEQPVEPPQSTADAEEEPPAIEELSRGNSADNDREVAAPSGWVSTQQAAKALGISPRTVRWHIEQGKLAAKPEGEGVRRTWLVSIDSLQAFRDTRQAAGVVPRGHRAPSGGTDIAAQDLGNPVRELADRLAEEAARAAEYRVRLELTEQAASSVQAELEEERRRREAAERERDDLRLRLEASREARESPVSPGPSETPTEQPGGSQEAREAAQTAAETLRGPEPRPPGGGTPEGLQRPAQPGRRRGALWRRVFGR